MAFDFATLQRAPGSLYRPHLLGRISGGGEDTGEIGHATWKEEELLQQNPQYLQMLAQQDAAAEQQRLEEEKFQLAKRQKEKEDYAKWEREQLLNSVADSKYLDKVMSGEMGSSQLLAKQMKEAAAEAMRRGQGKYAKDFLDIAGKYDQEAKKYEAGQMQLQDAKLEQAREVLGTVNDPVSWAYAKPKLAEAGIEIPQQFQSWSNDTAKWAGMQARQAKSVQASERLRLAEDAAAAKAEAARAKLETDQAKAQEKKTNEALKRELVGAGKQPSKEQTQLIIGELRGNEDFDDLEPSQQLAASSEYPAIAKYFLTSGQASTAAEANRMAKEDILARSKGGTFTPFVAGIPQAIKQGISPKDKQAIEWANQNKNDPRARQILNKFGI